MMESEKTSGLHKEESMMLISLNFCHPYHWKTHKKWNCWFITV